MERKKIYHIHTDFKFLYDSQRFEDELFNNQLIFIGEKNEKNALYHDSALFFSPDDLSKVLETVKDANLIVFYAMCDKKIKLLNQLPSSVKTAWRFFGYELYGTRHDLMFSTKTLEIMYKRKSYFLGVFFWLNFYYKSLKRYFESKKKLEYITKIDYILLFAEEEYIYLKKHWKMPKFVRLNLDNKLSERDFSKSENRVIVGNSRNSFNNHLDILDIISKHTSETNFTFFLNYGSEGRYYREVLERVHHLNNYTVFDEFLNKEEFERIYSTSSAFVLNSYRQMALGNIFAALKYGLKLYMNDKNPVKFWLNNNGITVSSITDLENDIKDKNLALTVEEKTQNIYQFNNLFSSYTKKDFCQKISNLISGENHFIEKHSN